ncbi:oligopeptide transport system substrate-binding protein [Verrucomicrobium sp. GAS474]|uniref:peptide ABC transporter substrate-binding protein n=1 Tax=Verrucomicrobium sp. GAS474 TaxID=1882831 RepID=UPI00087B985F|nr:peptide ABC transporter substrate-binding protein [Verrucomicrobium sp. GAS474]SDU25554.1 oligopeptide transport system substrate-binding protein [Verrucomicrobium sp. GAS474]
MNRLLLPLLALALAFTGCKKRETPVEKGDREGVLLLGNASEPSSIDPHMTQWDMDGKITAALFEGLTDVDSTTLQPIPATASSWEISPDGLTYTFHLRPEAKWSNGDPLTAYDFLYAARRILSPNLGSEAARHHFMVHNAQAYNLGKITDFSQVGYEVPDAHTFRLHLDYPVPYLLYLMSGDPWYPIHQKTIEKFGAIDQRDTAWTLPGNLVGNGAFTLKKWKVNDVIEVVKNPYYWDAAQVRLNAIRFFPIGSQDSEERAFRSGQIHVTFSMPLSKIDGYRAHHPEFFQNGPILVSYFYQFNVDRKPFDKVEVRRALALAIDRESIVKEVMRGGQVPAYRLTPPGMGAYDVDDSGPMFSADLAEAKRLLAAAGYPDGKGFPKVELLYNTSEGHRRIAEAIQQMWKKNLGIDVTLYNQEAKVYYETLQKKDYQVARMGWGGGYFDPTAFLDIMRGDAENNHTGWANPRYDGLMEQAKRTADARARLVLLKQAEHLLMDEMPLMPIYFYTKPLLVRPEVQGWRPNLLEAHSYKTLWLDPAKAGQARLEKQ